MAQQVFTDGESLASVQSKLNGNANDAEARFVAQAEEIAGKAAASHSHAISGVTGLQAALDAKQATLVSGTNLRTINGESLLGNSNLVIAGGGGSLAVIAGTDAAVTMLANRHYELEGSALTADRIYELPAGAVGDRIRVSLLSGNASFELILQGDTGITINGGSAAAEWSRLFIAREYVEFRANSTTNWDVWDDGRVASELAFIPNATINVNNIAWQTLNFPTEQRLLGLANSAGVYTVRRTNVYLIGFSCYITNAGASLTGITYYFAIAITKNGDISSGTTVGQGLESGASAGIVFPQVNNSQPLALSGDDTIRFNIFQNSGGTRRVENDQANIVWMKECLV